MKVLYSIVLLFSLAQSAWAGVSAEVDRDRLFEGDTLTLSLETDHNVSASPDLSPLRADFEVLGTARSSNISIINGRQSVSTGWQIRLRPRRLGDLVVPPLDIAGEKTRPLVVHVGKVPPEVARRNAEQLFVETEVDSGERPPYVQQQVKLIVRLYYRVRLLDGELSEPQPDGDVVFERLGKDRRYETVRNGRRYHVIEREYAMFPQRSGELRIPSVVFSGRVAVRESHQRAPSTRMDGMLQRFFGDDPFMDDFFNGSPFGRRGRSVVARSASQTLRVLPPPKDFHGSHWLPAADVKLFDSWAENPPELRVGEPVTRTLTLRAKGLEASQLPELQIEETPDYRVYAEAPSTRDSLEDGWVVGETRRDFAIVPQQAGRLLLPAIRIKWWDTQQNRERETLLPRWELSVLPGVAQPVQPAMPRPQDDAAKSGDTSVPTGRAEPERSLAAYWPWALPVLGALLLALWWRRLRKTAPAGDGKSRPQPAPRVAREAARAELRKACQEQDRQALARALLHLARLRWPQEPPLDLRALARRGVAHGDLIERLERALYAQGEIDEEALKTLCEAFRDGFGVLADKQQRAAPVNEDLTPLYPARGSGLDATEA